MNKSAASAASLDYVKFQAVIKSAASAASLRGGRASGRLDHIHVCAAAQKYSKSWIPTLAWSRRAQRLQNLLQILEAEGNVTREHLNEVGTFQSLRF